MKKLEFKLGGFEKLTKAQMKSVVGGKGVPGGSYECCAMLNGEGAEDSNHCWYHDAATGCDAQNDADQWAYDNASLFPYGINCHWPVDEC